MREHFAKSLQNEKMEQFPRSIHTAHTSIRRVATIPVYCTCQMPESLDNMVECETCYQWPDAWVPGQYGWMWDMLSVVTLSLCRDNWRKSVSWSCQECRGKGKTIQDTIGVLFQANIYQNRLVIWIFIALWMPITIAVPTKNLGSPQSKT